MNQNLCDKTEKLYEAFVLSEFSDLNGLAMMHSGLEELELLDSDWPDDTAVQAIHALKDLIQNVILDEVPDRDKAKETVQQTLSVLVQVAAAGSDSGKIGFPPELFEKVDAAPSESVAEPASELEETEKELSFLEGDPELLAEFITEAIEHLENASTQLLVIEQNSDDVEAVNAVFRAFHTIKGTSSFLGLDQVQGLAHVAENLLDRARNHEVVLDSGVLDICFDTIDVLGKMIEAVTESLESGDPLAQLSGLKALFVRIEAAASADGTPKDDKPLGRILVETGKATPEQVDDALESQREQQKEGMPVMLGEVLVQEGAMAKKDVAQALRVQSETTGKVKDLVKVDSARLDYLVDTIGEMVIAESMVSQAPEMRDRVSPKLMQNMNQLDKITHELQQVATSLRMVSVRATFQKMARLVRDVARKSGKNVEFIMEGEDTELDKSVVDKIGDPLVHMIRNAVDHGLESSAEERKAAGKSEVGRVWLRAFHRGGAIHIEIEDDGRGLDREVILAKAIERGVVSPTDELTDEEVWSLIFEAGFSTAEVVTEVSGRGVGMDVVRKNIESLRGQTEIRSTKGKGSIFSIRLPLTLAIIDGMVLRTGEERYIIPTLSITQSLRPEKKDLATAIGRGEMLSLHGSVIPLFRLGKLFNIPGAIEDPAAAIVVVVEYGGKQAGILVDELLGQQQTVIKSLGDGFQNATGLSGGAIMPDGSVGLIIDVAGLVESAGTHAEPGENPVASTKTELVLQES